MEGVSPHTAVHHMTISLHFYSRMNNAKMGPYKSAIYNTTIDNDLAELDHKTTSYSSISPVHTVIIPVITILFIIQIYCNSRSTTIAIVRSDGVDTLLIIK